MEYLMTSFVSGIICALVAGPESGLTAAIVGVVVVKVSKWIMGNSQER